MSEPTTAEIAFDLEMILQDENKTPDSGDYGNPEYFEMLCIGVAYREHPGAEIESDVLFREGSDAADELDLIRRFIEWVEDHDDADVVYTYNGDHFDYPQLRGRTRAAIMDANKGLDVLKGVEQFMESFIHDDLKHDVWCAFGDYTTLDEAADRTRTPMPSTYVKDYDTGISPRKWRGESERGNRTVTGGDMPGYGEQFLRYHEKGMTQVRTFHELRRLIYDYAESDVPVLFGIADERPDLREVTDAGEAVSGEVMGE